MSVVTVGLALGLHTPRLSTRMVHGVQHEHFSLTDTAIDVAYNTLCRHVYYEHTLPPCIMPHVSFISHSHTEASLDYWSTWNTIMAWFD